MGAHWSLGRRDDRRPMAARLPIDIDCERREQRMRACLRRWSVLFAACRVARTISPCAARSVKASNAWESFN